jgi:hypothetical protein
VLRYLGVQTQLDETKEFKCSSLTCYLKRFTPLTQQVLRRILCSFLDYSITNYLIAIIFALTLGQIGNSTPATPNFVSFPWSIRIDGRTSAETRH